MIDDLSTQRIIQTARKSTTTTQERLMAEFDQVSNESQTKYHQQRTTMSPTTSSSSGSEVVIDKWVQIYRLDNHQSQLIPHDCSSLACVQLHEAHFVHYRGA